MHNHFGSYAIFSLIPFLHYFTRDYFDIKIDIKKISLSIFSYVAILLFMIVVF